jgi:hypothetical protein
MNQNEKRVSLLENLLLSLKISTEASMMGPDLVEPISNPSPLSPGDVDAVSEESYANMLKEIAPEAKVVQTKAEVSEEEKELLRSVVEQLVDTAVSAPAEPRKMDANYESMSVKELQALARQRGLTGLPSRKRELVDALKKQGEPVPSAPVPLAAVDGDLEGAAEPGFSVDLEKS